MEIFGLGWPALTWLMASVGAVEERQPYVQCVAEGGPLSGPLTKLDKGKLFSPQIGQSFEEFLFPSHLGDATFPFLPPHLQKI